jgi:PKD repeat protein
VGIASASTITFSAAARDANNDSLTYTWAFGDGATGSGESATHVYSAPGTYAAKVTVSDSKASVEGGASVNVTTVSASWRSGSIATLCGPNRQTSGQLTWTITLTQSAGNISGTFQATGTCGTNPDGATGTLSGTAQTNTPRIVLDVVSNGIQTGTVFRLDPSPDGNTLTGQWGFASGTGGAPASFTRQ